MSSKTWLIAHRHDAQWKWHYDLAFAKRPAEELYDLKSDPGQNKNVITDHPDVVASLRNAYDQWWNDVQPLLVNEVSIGPKLNPFKELYWKQFGGGPDAERPK